MGHGLMGLAFGAGLIAVLNPCGFAMLPVYMTLVARGDGTGRVTALRRAVVATLDMVAGFMTVFGAFGLLTVSAAAAVQQYLPYVTVLIGGMLIGIGAWTLAGRHLRRLVPHGAMVGYGVGYAIASLSCTVGPFLAVTTAGMRNGVLADGLLTYLVYAAGMSLIVGVLAIAAAFANPVGVYRMRRILPYVNRIGGALVVAVGAYVAYYGVYEIRVAGAGTVPDDPVISAAGQAQNAVAMWVHTHGGYPWLAALTLLVLGAFVLAWGRMLRRTVRVRRVLELHLSEPRISSS
ncbi:cytochrome c biogenesis CcdA family protein [Mycobacterium sp. shizuoka-1]|uniref:cytochrome c biogenesis CcdA family protein n=1 Tax=Mycobacterium sp. shizuoka-1 TaxID=2039281 RepID=UPI000C05F0BA|nr:cytochrome c biogenesis CcdA family protein [Mycobacterium sp. shizuoka-1]GAY13295.1 cytochrome C biogenesis protein CcdA [Mycobacterium sp. shizuoka-1]